MVHGLRTCVQARIFPRVLKMGHREVLKMYRHLLVSFPLSESTFGNRSQSLAPQQRCDSMPWPPSGFERQAQGNTMAECSLRAMHTHGGETQLCADTHGVTVSSQGAQRGQVTGASANLSHLVQPIHFGGIEWAEAPVATVDPVTDTVTGLHRANVVRRFVELLLPYVSKV